jgi:hypothetical protein
MNVRFHKRDIKSIRKTGDDKREFCGRKEIRTFL